MQQRCNNPLLYSLDPRLALYALRLYHTLTFFKFVRRSMIRCGRIILRPALTTIGASFLVNSSPIASFCQQGRPSVLQPLVSLAASRDQQRRPVVARTSPTANHSRNFYQSQAQPRRQHFFVTSPTVNPSANFYLAAFETNPNICIYEKRLQKSLQTQNATAVPHRLLTKRKQRG